MTTPIKTFWMLNASIDRIRAQSDMRSMTVASVAQSGEAYQEYRESLILEMGSTVTADEPEVEEGQSNSAGFAELKALSEMM